MQIPGFPPDTAGGIMSTEFLTVPGTATVEDALQRIRTHHGGLDESVCATYVVDAKERVRRVVSLRELVSSDPTRRLSELGHKKNLCTVGLTTDREDVARLIARYDLLAVPVVGDLLRIAPALHFHSPIRGITAVQSHMEASGQLANMELVPLSPITCMWSQVRRAKAP